MDLGDHTGHMFHCGLVQYGLNPLNPISSCWSGYLINRSIEEFSWEIKQLLWILRYPGDTDSVVIKGHIVIITVMNTAFSSCSASSASFKPPETSRWKT